MNKKGFTLIEVLGVMVIIIALTLIVLPNIINRFSNKKEDISKTNKEIIVSAAKLYVSENKDELNDYTTYCIGVDKLIENNYLSEKKDVFTDNDYASNHMVKVTIGKPYEYEVVESEQCKNSGIYATGNKIKVNDIEFYIVSNHDDYVVALKAKPLTVMEVNKYGGVGTDHNHVNMYVHDFVDYYQRAYGCLNEQFYVYDYNYDDPQNDDSVCQEEYDWGRMAYYASSKCFSNASYERTDCHLSYQQSEIKHVVDAWASDKFTNELKAVNDYASRLITVEELVNDLNCSYTRCYESWISDDSFAYWTMTEVENSKYKDEVYTLYNRFLHKTPVYTTGNYNGAATVRPAINVYKSAIQFE